MNIITATKIFFIKLGEKGSWEQNCIADGTLRLGYHDLNHQACLDKNKELIRQTYSADYNNGAATRHIDQVMNFYHEPASTLWITFYSDRLWWCFSEPQIQQLSDKSKIRPVINQWSDKDTNGNILFKGKLSGKLLSVQGFQGTICDVKEKSYLLHKINGTYEPHVENAISAVKILETALIPIIKNLHPKDFETLTDLIFRQAGWQRIGVAGEVEKDIDLDLISPITQERIAIQIKSKTNLQTYNTYKSKFENMLGFSKFYFVTHTAEFNNNDIANNNKFIFWDENELAKQALRNGLIGWLIDRAS